jgi:L-ascorbate metabolism protein UlaG (beta-lactamase superfamily)
LTFDNGTSVLTDYGKSRAYDLDSPIYELDFVPDVVTYSHKHEDHAGGKIPDGVHHILEGTEGLKLDGIDVKAIPTYEQSLDEPDNTSYLFAYKGIKILHLGDCQALMLHSKEEKVRAKISELYPDKYDLVLVPIGFVSDIVENAVSFIGLIDADAVVPMHYWTPSEKTRFLERLQDERSKKEKSYRVENIGDAHFDLGVSAKPTNEIRVINLEPGPYDSST